MLNSFPVQLFDNNKYEENLLQDVITFYEEFLNMSGSGNLKKEDYSNLRQYFYENFYKRKKQYQNLNQQNVQDFTPSFLSVPVNHKSKFSRGWLPEGNPDNVGRLIVNKRAGFERKLLPAGTYLRQDLLSNFVDKNQEIEVRIPDRWNITENNIRNDVYAHFYGETLADDLGENKNIVRIYFNFNPSADNLQNHLNEFMTAYMLKFNRRKIPFHLKIVKHPQGFYADNVVLYIERRYLILLLDIIEEVYDSIAPTLRKEVPMFTYPLKDGIGFAEGIDPQYTEESFGLRVTDTVYNLCFWLQNKKIEVGNITIDQIKEGLKSIKRKKYYLFLNEDSTFEYNINIPNLVRKLGFKTDETPELDQVIRFGYALCKDAIWDNEGRCTWIGQYGDIYKPLNNNYLDGLSGILLYLTELFKVSKKPLFQRFGIGLYKTIIHKFEKDSTFQFGFHIGTISKLYVLKKAASILELEPVNPDIDITNVDENTPLDVYGGVAGTLLGLLLLKQESKDNLYDKQIETLTTFLLSKKQWISDDYFYKDSQNYRSSVNTPCFGESSKKPIILTGFSHGISGIAYVLSLYNQLFPLNKDINELRKRINESIEEEQNTRRISVKSDSGLTDNIWLDLCSQSEGKPIIHWERGTGSVSYARIGLNNTIGYGNFLEDIIAEFDYCKSTISNNILNVESGFLDYLIECYKLSLIPKSQILENLKPYLENFENDNFTVFWKSIKKPIYHPSLIGTAGIGMGLLRLYDSRQVNSYILPA